MFYHLKIAIRNLSRDRRYSIINVGGLAIAMAAAGLLLLWIQNQLSYDKFHKNGENIYVVWNKGTVNNTLRCWEYTPGVLGPVLLENYPDIKDMTRYLSNRSFLFRNPQGEMLTLNASMADPGFLRMFNFPLKSGNAGSALNDIYSAIITEKTAKRFFGDDDPMGQTLLLDNQHAVIVTGIMADLPDNTVFDFEILLPQALMKTITGWEDNNWGSYNMQTYVELQPSASEASVNNAIAMVSQNADSRQEVELFIHPLLKNRLYNRFENGINTSGETLILLKVLAAIAASILVIACINFTNLSTARSIRRAREVGVKKVIGAKRRGLIWQFLGESILTSFVAGIIALALVVLALPAFNNLIASGIWLGKGFAFPANHIWFWASWLVFVFFTGIIAGAWPAFYLSSFYPIKALKGIGQGIRGKMSSRKILIVTQFAFAVIMITASITLYRQIQFGRDRFLGYDKHNLVYVNITDNISKNYANISRELEEKGAAISITKTSNSIAKFGEYSDRLQWGGKDPEDKTIVQIFGADTRWVATTGMKLKEGRDIDLSLFPTDSSAILISESMVKLTGFDNPIGEIIQNFNNNYHVVGVVEDIIINGMFNAPRPTVIFGAGGPFYITFMHFRLNPANSIGENLRIAESIFMQYDPDHPFNCHFIDREHEMSIAGVILIGKFAGIFAGFAIFISCLGLFGLSTYMAENRRKEIGIRKVFGARVLDITIMLSKEYLKLTLIAFVIAAPLGWLAMNQLLNTIPYRTNIPVWLMTAIGVLTLLIALLTVGFQAVRAATANPVKAIKSE